MTDNGQRGHGLFSAVADEAARLAGAVQSSVVVVITLRGGHGAGIIWRRNGLIITNHHVVAGTDRVEVRLNDGQGFPARVTKRVPEHDLAALSVEADDLPAAPIGSSRTLRAGELVFAVGHPLGVKGAVVAGMASGLAKNVRIGGLVLPEALQAVIDLYPGNSGGPRDLARLLALKADGSSIRLGILRGGKPIELVVGAERAAA